MPEPKKSRWNLLSLTPAAQGAGEIGVAEALDEGWEPFAATVDRVGRVVYHLRRRESF